MLQSWITQLGASAVVLVCVFALICGTWRERFGAFIYLCAYGLSLGFGLISLSQTAMHPASQYLTRDYINLYLLVADMLVLQGFCVVAWKSPHPWPKWAVLGQLISLALHGVMLMDGRFGIDISARMFLTLQTALGWGVLLALLIGTLAALRTRRQARLF